MEWISLVLTQTKKAICSWQKCSETKNKITVTTSRKSSPALTPRSRRRRSHERKRRIRNTEYEMREEKVRWLVGVCVSHARVEARGSGGYVERDYEPPRHGTFVTTNTIRANGNLVAVARSQTPRGMCIVVRRLIVVLHHAHGAGSKFPHFVPFYWAPIQLGRAMAKRYAKFYII